MLQKRLQWLLTETGYLLQEDRIDEDELREFMLKNDNHGIGTVATRAGIVESLIQRRYAYRDMKSAILTAKWEKRIASLLFLF